MADIVYSQGFTEQVKLKDDGYPALVSALNTAWFNTNQAVAKEIKVLVGKG
jgi:uncharacterized lipoprotein YmbA